MYTGKTKWWKLRTRNARRNGGGLIIITTVQIKSDPRGSKQLLQVILSSFSQFLLPIPYAMNVRIVYVSLVRRMMNDLTYQLLKEKRI